jgi:hypothetical protein
MAASAALLRSVGRCAILLEQTLLKLLDNWMRHQAKRLRANPSHAGIAAPAQELTRSPSRKEQI